jgi:hypothetical protein
VLFLDELPEFDSRVPDSLRQRVIQISQEDFGPNRYWRDPKLTWQWMSDGDGLKILAFARYGQLQNVS